MEKKTPLRMCIACRRLIDKRQLLRVVKSGDRIFLDLTGKASGRGAYICDNPDCVAKLKKQRLLNKVFSCAVSDEVYGAIEEAYLAK